MPLVDHDAADGAEALGGLGPAQEHGQRLGRGHQRRGKASSLAPSDGARRVTAATLDRPARRDVGGDVPEVLHEVLRERPHGRDPDHRQRRGVASLAWRAQSSFVLLCVDQRTHPGGEALAEAGGGVDQAAPALKVVRPCVTLEVERFPAARLEPGDCGVHGRYELVRAAPFH